MNIFKDKIAIVTGGASGIGRALCHELGRRGAMVVVTDINAKVAKDVSQEIISEGGRSLGLGLDVTRADDVSGLVERIGKEYGHLDYMFNNAGISITGELRDTPLSDWRKAVDINLMGVVHGVRAAYCLMVKQGSGHIINTASVAGLAPTPFLSTYSATKHAVVGLSAAARIEGADLGVKVSVVCPGVVKTPLIDTQTYRSLDKEKALASIPMMISPEKCARVVMKGIARNRAIIPVGLDGNLLYYVYRFFPGLHRWGARFFTRRTRRLVRIED